VFFFPFSFRNEIFLQKLPVHSGFPPPAGWGLGTVLVCTHARDGEGWKARCDTSQSCGAVGRSTHGSCAGCSRRGARQEHGIGGLDCSCGAGREQLALNRFYKASL